ncbi:hypothetical protein DBR06_SOUSAS810131, partial [Sousa chinensis]
MVRLGEKRSMEQEHCCPCLASCELTCTLWSVHLPTSR